MTKKRDDWFCVSTNILNNPKIIHIRDMPEGNSIFAIWIMILAIARRCNAGGYVFFTKKIPYNSGTLAKELRVNENVMRMALTAFEELDMITRDGNMFFITNWGEYQNADGLDEIRKKNNERQKRYRERQRMLIECSDEPLTIVEPEPEQVKEDTEELSFDVEKPKPVKTEDVKKVIEEWNRLQEFGIKPVTRLKSTSARCIKLKDLIREQGIDNILKAIENIRKSNFLQGKVNGFMVDFTWFIKPEKFKNILDGKYNDKGGSHSDGTGRKVEQDVKPIIPFDEWNGDSDTPFNV